MSKYILLETLLGEYLSHLPVGLQIPQVPCKWSIMYCLQNIILEYGLMNNIDLVFVVDDVIHYHVLVILNNPLY